MTMPELSDLLTSVTPGPYKTTRAAKACVAKLASDLAVSEAALAAARGKISSLQLDLDTSNQAVTDLLQAAQDTNHTLDRNLKEIAMLRSVASEGRRELAALHKSISQLTESGAHDRSRLVEVIRNNKRLRQLHDIASYTCAKMRRQRDDLELELRALKSISTQDKMNSSSSRSGSEGCIKAEWNSVTNLSKPQVG